MLHRTAAAAFAAPPPAATAAPPPSLSSAAVQLCTTSPQLTLDTLNELLGLLGAWLHGEHYHGAHHLRGASSSLRPVGEGLPDLVGNTPLIRLKSLSEQTGCEVRMGVGRCATAHVCSG